MNGKIIVVDDDHDILSCLSIHLSKVGFHVTEAPNAGEALQLLRTESFDLMLLDLGLPDVDGISFCRRIRAGWNLPIIMVTGRSDSFDKVVGLEVGADDYVTKPFDPPELVARIRAQLRRQREYGSDSAEPQRIAIGHVTIDESLHDALVDGHPASLTDREFDLLWLLASNQGRALDKDWIFEQIWGYDAELGIKMLSVYVRRLRQKIERDPDNPSLLHTIRGHGYRLASEEEAGKLS